MSNLVEHARHELKLLGWLDSEEEYDRMIAQAVLEIVEKFSEQGHSGMSAGFAVQALNKLLRFEPILPLTGEDDEWVHVHDGESGDNLTYQNKRSSNVFKDSSGAYQHDYYIFRSPNGSGWTSQQSRKYVEFPFRPDHVELDIAEDASEEDMIEAVRAYEESVKDNNSPSVQPE